MTNRESQTKVIILTGAYRIKGYIDLPPGSRVTDYMVGAKDFIAVTDAEVWAVGGSGLVLAADFIDVSREQIQVVTASESAHPSTAAVAGMTGGARPESSKGRTAAIDAVVK